MRNPQIGLKTIQRRGLKLFFWKGPGRVEYEMNDRACAPQKIGHGKAFSRLVHPAIGVVGPQAEWRDISQSVHQFGDKWDGSSASVQAGSWS